MDRRKPLAIAQMSADQKQDQLMRFFYLDSGLRGEIGHHANLCRAITAELRERKIHTKVVAWSGIEEPLKEELGASALLHWYIYDVTTGDPLAGWLHAFEQAWQTTQQDLGGIDGVQSDDIVYVAAALPGQLLGVVKWLADLPKQARPFVCVDLLGPPGIELRKIDSGILALPRREDPRAMLYRYAANHGAGRDIGRLIISYGDKTGAQAYSHVLNMPTASLPLPFRSFSSPRNRARQRSMRLGVIGAQRNQEKGYHLVRDVLEAVAASWPEIRILVHNSHPHDFDGVAESMRNLAHSEPRVSFDERPLDASGWSRLWERTDLVLCPYSPEAYQFMTSGIHAEAIANAIPGVVPAGTSLSRSLQEFGNPGTTFDRFDVPSIVDATNRVLQNFDEYANRAFAAAQKWHQVHGPKHLVDAILSLAQSR